MVPETSSRDMSSSSLLESSHAIDTVSPGVAVSVSPGVAVSVSLLAVDGSTACTPLLMSVWAS